MKPFSQRLRRCGRRATTLVFALIFVLSAAVFATLMARTLLDQQNINNRRRELARAYYLAEAGVAQVLEWGNHPAEYTPNPTLFARGSNNFQALRTAINGGGVSISQSALQSMGVGQFNSKYGYAVGTIKSIDLLTTSTSDPVSCLFKIRSVGRSADGRERTVLAYARANPAFTVSIPAALVSLNTASAFGNARVHWGEAWSKMNFSMLNESQMGYVQPGNAAYDKWAKYRTEGVINFPASWKWGEGKDLYDATRVQPGLAPASGKYADAFYQHLPAGSLQWPTMDYQTFKEMAIAHGRYYSTDAAGHIYRGGVEDAAHMVSDFLTEFGVADRASAPYDLLFIDTINGQPPAADGSNLATLSVSGSGLGLKGVFWIGANFDGGGVGSPPLVWDALDPDGHPPSSALPKIFLEGVLYSAGTVALSGNAGVYGSVVAQRGFSGGGTPDIWYNHALAHGLELNGNTGSVFTVVLRTNY